MCKSRSLDLVIDLGKQPHSDDFIEPDRLVEVEHMYPLRLVTCSDCGLLQIDYFVNPDILYRTNYIYESSITKKGVSHYRQMAEEISSNFNFEKGSLAVDIGSNVGVLLSGFKENGFKVLGVDPAEAVAKKAIDSGIDTVVNYFSSDVAYDIANKHGKAKVITGTNVFAHLHEIDSAVEGISSLLDDDGVLVIEAPYALDLVKNCEYDTIYHQHIGYLSIKPMARYFKNFNLELFDVIHRDIHGGTLRYYIGHEGARAVSEKISEGISEEEEFGLYNRSRLKDFAKSVLEQRRKLITLLESIKSKGQNVVGISAPAKGNTLLNFCNIDNHYLDFITEKSQLKQGRYTPGTGIPIFDDDKILQEQPDYALILAWNFADEIIKNHSEYSKRGGKFIIPIPEPRIVD